LYAWPPETHPVFVLVFALVTTAYSDTVRHYFIQAQDSVWDFAPAARIWSTAVRFLIPGTHSHTFGKVRYIEYTDASFFQSETAAGMAWDLGADYPCLRWAIGSLSTFAIAPSRLVAITECIHTVFATRKITKERTTYRQVPGQRFRLAVNLSITGSRTMTAAQA